MIDLSILPLYMSAVLVLMITPGADLVYILGNALARGPLAGAVSLIGVGVGASIHVVMAAAGLAAIFAASPVLYDVVRYAGAAYLCYLGVKFILSRKSDAQDIKATGKHSYWAMFRGGILTNLLNPKGPIFVLSFLPQFVTPGYGPVWSQMLVLGAILVAMMVILEMPFILASGHFAKRLKGSGRVGVWINRTVGGLLIALALHLAFDRKTV